MTSRDSVERRLLDAVEQGNVSSQRSLAKELGVALGLTNLLLRRCATRGWLRVIHIKPNRVRYLITPAGIAEKARMTRSYLEASVKFYAEARDRIRQGFARISANWPIEDEISEKRVLFFGAGEVAEIGYACLQESDLSLVGVVDENARLFLGMAVVRIDDLNLSSFGHPQPRLVVMSFADAEEIRSTLQRADVRLDNVDWL